MLKIIVKDKKILQSFNKGLLIYESSFSVTGEDKWADIGVLDIFLYESQDQTNWTWVKTFSFEDYPEMLDHNSNFHMSYVTYQGKLARYYRAYVCIWAGDENNNGDTRYIWTPVEFASPLN